MVIQTVCYLVNEQPPWQVYFTDGTGIGSPTEESLIAACPEVKDWLTNNQARTIPRFSDEINPNQSIAAQYTAMRKTVEELRAEIALIKAV